MNQIATRDERAITIESKIDRSISNAISVGTGGITFQNAGEVMEYAKMMAVSGSAVPKHLRGQPGACLGIIDDAIRFQTSPYALARKSFFVNDNLAYEAQVIAGIVNRFAPLKERPNVEYEGEGATRKCIVTFKFRDGSIRTYESPLFKDITPKNSPLWKNDPDQQLSYYSLRAGARRHCPEIILGMYDIEEMHVASMRNVTPEQPPVMERLQQRQASNAEPASEGFNREFVDRETGELTDPSDIVPETGEDTATLLDDTQSAPDAPEADAPPSDQSSEDAPGGGDPSPDDSPAMARDHGAKWRLEGRSRKACPPVYRNVAELAEAWCDGFDGPAE